MNKSFGKANNMDIYERLKNGEPINTRESREFKEILWPLDVRAMFFVGKATAQKLHDFGIKTIGELAAARFARKSIRSHRLTGKCGRS